MKIKQTITIFIFASFIGAFLMSPFAFAFAAGDNCTSVDKLTSKQKCLDGKVVKVCGGTVQKEGQGCVNGVVTSVITNLECGTGGDIENSCVWSLLIMAINILTAGIGLVAVGGIVYGSILYTSAGGNAENTKQGIKIIQNVVIGLVAYAAMYGFLNYIIPGGMF